jgi:membrane protein DedA with SNARE-associated domain
MDGSQGVRCVSWTPPRVIQNFMSIWVFSVLPLALHLQNKHIHGSPVDYAAVVLSSAASWVGLPGPGEAVVVTAGIVAAHGHLNLGPVLLYAWVGATAGGIAGWLIGLKAGRTLITTPGPFLRLRLHALNRSERLYDRFGPMAVFLTPSWGAGIARVGAGRYLPANLASAAIWALLFGLGSYLAGRTLTDLFSEIGLVAAVVIACGILGGGLIEARRRARRRRRSSNAR